MSFKAQAKSLTASLAVLAISIALFPQAIFTINILGSSIKSHISPDLTLPKIQQVLTPRGGEIQVLPETVQTMIYLLRANDIKTYRYSQAIGEDGYVRQRLIEGAYPIKYAPESSYLLLFEKERASSSCELVSNSAGVKLASCP